MGKINTRTLISFDSRLRKLVIHKSVNELQEVIVSCQAISLRTLKQIDDDSN